jgi:hypothetical protein
MATETSFQSKTVCIGLNVAWWGGQGRGNPASSADLLLGHQVGSLRPWRQVVDLRAAPNALAADHCQPNFDAEALLITAAIRKELARLTEAGAERFILAIDAPLVTTQAGLTARRRVAKKGEKGAVTYRTCETRLVEKVRSVAGVWRRTVNVQPGAPLPPRIAQLVTRLTTDLGFTYWNSASEPAEQPERLLIEVYPFEAIWALGSAGFYGGNDLDWVNTYKKLERCVITRQDGLEFARRPLGAYASLLSSLAGLSSSIDTLAAWACDGKSGDDSFKVTRRYEAVVDAAMIWLTALAFTQGSYHVFSGTDGDGTLVGPSQLTF